MLLIFIVGWQFGDVIIDASEHVTAVALGGFVRNLRKV